MKHPPAIEIARITFPDTSSVTIYRDGLGTFVGNGQHGDTAHKLLYRNHADLCEGAFHLALEVGYNDCLIECGIDRPEEDRLVHGRIMTVTDDDHSFTGTVWFTGSWRQPWILLRKDKQAVKIDIR